MKYLIELPDVLRDEKGNEYEPTGEFRSPKIGETFISDIGRSVKALNNFHSPRIILRLKWSWPTWLGGWGFALNANGEIHWHANKAERRPTTWSSKGRELNIGWFGDIAPDFTPPPITNWTIPTINPNWKG